MGDNKNLAIMAAEAYKIAIPEVVVPKDAPTWVRQMFSQLITSIYVSCNKNIECLVVDFNKSIDHLQSQVNRMEDTIKQMTRTHTAEMKKVRDTLHTKQYQVDNNATVISDLKETINKNESYSRRLVETTLFLADSTWIETTNAVVMKLSEKIYLSKH